MSRFVIQLALLSLAMALPAWPASPPQPRQNQQAPKDQKDQPDRQDQQDQKNQPDQKSEKDQTQNTKPDPGESSSSSSSSSAAPGLTQELQQEETKYDPFPSEQDVEVGTYYMHKGDFDAAIPRFEDAIRLRANFAKPRMLLAEIYEKKGDKTAAVKYYKEYLQVYPHAPDAAKVQKKIDKLTTR
jgi:tetratricopeptide (TPR) repeat protein